MTPLRLLTRSLLVAVVALAATAPLAGCGDDDTDPDAGARDAGRDGAVPDDGAGPDAGRRDAGPIETVTVTGRILGEDVGAGPPPIDGATVSFVWPDGITFDSGMTNAEGRYSVTAPRGMLMLHRVEPLTDYLGTLRAENVGGMDYEYYELRLGTRDGVVDVVGRSGATYDPTRGYLVAGFNPVSVMDGGEGATLSGVTHDPAFVLWPDGLAVTNVLPRICGSGEDPVADGCALTGRLHQVFFPNIVGTPATVEVIDPAGGTCARRFPVSSWPVFPDTIIDVALDCAAL